jgi:hypothetical protein
MICNIVEDAKINEMLKPGFSTYIPNPVMYFTVENLFHIPEDWLKKFAMEEVVDRIIKEAPKVKISIDSGGCGGIGEGGIGNNGKGCTILNEGAPELRNASEESLLSVKRDLITESIMISKSIGLDDGFLQRIFDEIYKTEVNWKRVLRNTLASAGGDEVKKIWNRLNRKSDLLPSVTTIGHNTVWCLIDTSGSIGKTEINRWVSEILAIMRLKRKVVVVSWDTAVHDVVRIHNKQDINEMELHGGGCTMIKSALEYVAKEKKYGDVVVVLSDFEISDLSDKEVQSYLSKSVNFTTYLEPEKLKKEYRIKAVKIKVK